MYTNINAAKSEQLLETKINENYDLIEVSATGLDCDILRTLVNFVTSTHCISNSVILSTNKQMAYPWVCYKGYHI